MSFTSIQLSRIVFETFFLTCPAKSSSASTPQKYCSHACRTHRPSTRPDSIEHRIERTFLSLLRQTKNKGAVVSCSAVEETVFQPSDQTEQQEGLESTNPDATPDSDIGGGNDGEIKEEGKKKKRQERGMQKAREREMVRQAARRLVVFGVPTTVSSAVADGDGDHDEQADRADSKDEASMQLEAVQGERVVEPSFAKGEWGVRWKT